MLQTIHKGTLSAKYVLEEWAKEAMQLPDLEQQLARLLEVKEDEPDRLQDCDAGGVMVKVHIDALVQAKRNELLTVMTCLNNCNQALHEAHDRLQSFNPLADKVVEEAPMVGVARFR